jgi:hypothetical protein
MTSLPQKLGMAAGLVMALASGADGALPRGLTRTIPSANGKYLLVLLDPDPGERRLYDPAVDGPQDGAWIRGHNDSIATQQQIEGTYRRSGLYRNDGSTTLLWPIPYISISKDTYVADDGVHLVVAFLDWTGSASDRGNAFEFYTAGRLVAAYNEHDVLPSYWGRAILAQVFGASRPTCTAAQLDNQRRVFEVTTTQGDTIGFDFTTGQLSYLRSYWSPWMLAIAAGVPGAAWLLWRRLRRARMTGSPAIPLSI